MGWNQGYKNSWHPKGSRCSAGGAIAKFVVIGNSGYEFRLLAQRKYAEQECERINSGMLDRPQDYPENQYPCIVKELV
jgi:hypothetical protein